VLVRSSILETLSEASATEYAGSGNAVAAPALSAWTEGGIGGGSGHIGAVGAVGRGSAADKGVSGPAAATRIVGTLPDAGSSVAATTGSGCRAELSMSRGPVGRI
jgi:hypothetical protein